MVRSALTRLRVFLVAFMALVGVSFAGAAAAQTWTIDDYYYYTAQKAYYQTSLDQAESDKQYAEEKLANLSHEYNGYRSSCYNYWQSQNDIIECLNAFDDEESMVRSTLEGDIAAYEGDISLFSNEIVDVNYTIKQIEDYLWP